MIPRPIKRIQSQPQSIELVHRVVAAEAGEVPAAGLAEGVFGDPFGHGGIIVPVAVIVKPGFGVVVTRPVPERAGIFGRADLRDDLAVGRIIVLGGQPGGVRVDKAADAAQPVRDGQVPLGVTGSALKLANTPCRSPPSCRSRSLGHSH